MQPRIEVEFLPMLADEGFVIDLEEFASVKERISNSDKRADILFIKDTFNKEGKGQFEIYLDNIKVERLTLRSHKIYREASNVASSEAKRWLHDLRKQVLECEASDQC